MLAHDERQAYLDSNHQRRVGRALYWQCTVLSCQYMHVFPCALRYKRHNMLFFGMLGTDTLHLLRHMQRMACALRVPSWPICTIITFFHIFKVFLFLLLTFSHHELFFSFLFVSYGTIMPDKHLTVTRASATFAMSSICLAKFGASTKVPCLFSKSDHQKTILCGTEDDVMGNEVSK